MRAKRKKRKKKIGWTTRPLLNRWRQQAHSFNSNIERERVDKHHRNICHLSTSVIASFQDALPDTPFYGDAMITRFEIRRRLGVVRNRSAEPNRFNSRTVELREKNFKKICVVFFGGNRAVPWQALVLCTGTDRCF